MGGAGGQVVGKVNFKNGDKILGSVDVISNSKILENGSKSNGIMSYISNKWWFWALISLIVLRIIVGIRRVMYRAKMLREKSKKVRKKGQATR